jgi:hypothetical protein
MHCRYAFVKFATVESQQAAIDAGVGVAPSSSNLPAVAVTIHPARVAEGLRKKKDLVAQQLARRTVDLCKAVQAAAEAAGPSVTRDDRICRQLNAVVSLRNADEAAQAHRSAAIDAVKDLARAALGPDATAEPHVSHTLLANGRSRFGAPASKWLAVLCH